MVAQETQFQNHDMDPEFQMPDYVLRMCPAPGCAQTGTAST